MRILAFFLSSNRYGEMVSGEERRFLELSSRLNSLGAKIFALEYEPSISESWGYPSCHSIGLNHKFRSHYGLEALRLTIHSLISCIMFDCDLIYVPAGFPWPLNIIFPAYVVSIICRKPLVLVFHHLHKHARYQESGIIKRTIILIALKHAKVCISVSQATADDVKKNFGAGNFVVTGNGVNLERFKDTGDQRKIYDAIYFGRISKEKGIDTLLKAWKLVTEKLPSAELLLAGGMNVNGKYTEIARKLRLDRNTIFAGFVSDQEAVKLLNSSRIFVLPSSEEGFGLTILEAMATSLPCIVTDLPALRENFEKVAIFVKPNDVGGLAKEILALLYDPDKRAKLKERGKEVAERFSWERVAKKELEVLKSVA